MRASRWCRPCSTAWCVLLVASRFSHVSQLLGAPGTGKSTVAALLGPIYRDLGVLSKGDIVVKSAADFIGAATGESEAKTRAILAATLGGVLVIDEAYMLAPQGGAQEADPFRGAVVDTIVSIVQSVPGEDRCVLMLGYPEEMQALLDKSNPGLARRFDVSNAFVFADYSDSELHRILNSKLADKGLRADWEAQTVAVDVLAMKRRKQNFGNGGAVENLIGYAVLRMTSRLQTAKEQGPVAPEDEMCLIATDFSPTYGVAHHDILAELSDFIGSEGIVRQLQSIKNAVIVARAKGNPPKMPMTFQFVGNSGTGKTTVARRLGRILHGMDMLATDEVVEAAPADLIAGFVGQTPKKVHDLLVRATGKVLFIDEAYGLNPAWGGAFATEAVNNLVRHLTSTEFAGRIVVVLAGYSKDMAALMTSNQGLASRFPTLIGFQDLSTADCASLLASHVAKGGFALGAEAMSEATLLFSDLSVLPSFGNGRDVESIGEELMQLGSDRAVGLGCDLSGDIGIQAEDVRLVFDDRIRQRTLLQEQQDASSGAAVGTEKRKSGDLYCSASSEQRVARRKTVQLEASSERVEDEEMVDEARVELGDGEELSETDKLLNSIGKCEAGYKWVAEGDGYRCAGGTHFVSGQNLRVAMNRLEKERARGNRR